MMAKHRISNRCPRCKGGTFGVTTTVVIDMWREFENGVQTFGPAEASLHSDLASFGKCRCGHQWRLRNPALDYVEVDADHTNAGANGGNKESK